MLRQLRIQSTLLFSALIFVAGVFQSAEAQRRAMGGMRPGNVSPARLLTVDEVQTELKLTDEQKAKVPAINEMLTTGRQELFAQVAKDSGNRSSKMAELEQQSQARIEKLLDPAQKQRLNELLLQVNGAAALSQNDVQEALNITKEQQNKLANVRRTNAEVRRKSLANFDGDRTAKSGELQREANAKLLEVLTEEQRKQFEAMQGERVDIDLFAS